MFVMLVMASLRVFNKLGGILFLYSSLYTISIIYIVLLLKKLHVALYLYNLDIKAQSDCRFGIFI